MTHTPRDKHSPPTKIAVDRPRAIVPAGIGRAARWALVVALTLGLGATGACHRPPDAAYTQLQDANRLVADLRVSLHRAANESDRAVMADTDEASVAFAREAEGARQSAQRDADALTPLFRSLGYTREAGLLADFRTRFAAYEAQDREVLALAVENTNLKAQRLSFGPAREAADAFRSAVDALAAAALPENTCRAASLGASAVLAVREIQVLDAPHIAEAGDDAMTRMESEMARRETLARTALHDLEPLVDPASRPQLARAVEALDRFMSLHAQLIAFSRRNTNVRSLALSLGQMRTLTAACQVSLDALAAALASEGSRATR